MNQTPLANRKQIAIFGDTNAGKSALFNAILNQDITIVSSVKGTTTDPVIKAMELIPYGPVALIDTAGFSDFSALGDKRNEKTRQIFDRADFAIYAADINAFSKDSYNIFLDEIKKRSTGHILVFTKSDTASVNDIEKLKKDYPLSLFVSIKDENTITILKDTLSKSLSQLCEQEISIISGLVNSLSSVILVCPIDSAAPKGRLILPQVQLIRDCLDNAVKCYVVRETELESALCDIKNIALVVTDSQAFSYVNKIVPKNIALTSFSLLMARQKGDLAAFFAGAKAIENLKDGSKVLIAEGCTHNVTHEDIGMYKIPNGIKNRTNKNIEFEFTNGYLFPDNIEKYDLIIHCGACMLNRKTVLSRIALANEKNVPITNYGVVLAYLTGITSRCEDFFEGKL